MKNVFKNRDMEKIVLKQCEDIATLASDIRTFETQLQTYQCQLHSKDIETIPANHGCRPAHVHEYCFELPVRAK